MKQKRAQALLWTVIIVVIILVVVNSFVFYFYFNSNNSSTSTQKSSTTGNSVLENNLQINPNSNNPPLNIQTEIPSTGKKYSLDIVSHGFSPQTLHIEPGDTIIWTNRDSISHTVTSDSGNELSSGNIDPSQNYIHTFNNDGFYSYHCSIHPDMTGTIVVGDRTLSSPQTTSSTMPITTTTSSSGY